MTMVKRPTIEQLQQIVRSLHMSMSDREVGEYLDVLEGTMQAYDRVEKLPDYLPEVRYPRTPGTGRRRRRTRSAPGTSSRR